MASAYDAVIDSICYNLNDTTKTAEVTYHNSSSSNDNFYSGSIIIPEKVTYNDVSYTVTTIGNNAFFYCRRVTSVNIPESVTVIGNYSFYNCIVLASVNIPKNVTCIGSRAFSECTSLTSVTFPNGLRTICSGAFYNCNGLTSVTIPSSIDSIGPNPFAGCPSLTSLVVEKGNAVYDSRENCNAIIKTATNTLISGCKTTVIPNSVTSIDFLGFCQCTGLTSITIPANVTSIGERAFLRCTGLDSVTILGGVTILGAIVFLGCTSLTSVNLPNSLTSIGSNAFSNCTSLTSVNIPDSVTFIGSNAFSNCTSLTSVDIPNSLTSIGSNAFLNCTSLTSVDIPDSVTSIGSGAFYGCANITEIVIGKGIENIGDNAFYSCPKLTNVTCKAKKVPQTSLSAFNKNTIMRKTLYVPKSYINAYKAKEPWKNFMAIKAVGTYKLTYMVNDAFYKTVEYVTGEFIAHEPAPEKEGYTFSGWSAIPIAMPAEDVVVKGTLTENVFGRCSTPTISYENGEITFDCDTEDADFHYTIAARDMQNNVSSRVALSKSYAISVYAAKPGYENSETATATICWIDVEPQSQSKIESLTQIRTNAVLIKSVNGLFTVSGVDDGTIVTISDLSGRHVGMGNSINGTATISTSLGNGEVAIVTIGNKSVKVTVGIDRTVVLYWTLIIL